MSDGWSQWFLHDGSGCPVKGQLVQTEDGYGEISEHIAYTLATDYDGRPFIVSNETDLVDCWDWSSFTPDDDWNFRIIAYRVKKSEGFKLLENLLELETV